MGQIPRTMLVNTADGNIEASTVILSTVEGRKYCDAAKTSSPASPGLY